MKLHTRPGAYHVDATRRITMEGPFSPRHQRSMAGLRVAFYAAVALLLIVPFIVAAFVFMAGA